MGARAAVITVLVGCYDPTVATDVPCGPGGACPANQRCDPDTNRCTLGDGGVSDSPRIDVVDTMPDSSSATIQFRAYTYVDGSTNTTTINVPMGTQDGDFLLAHVSDDLTSIGNVNTPAGWTKVIERDGVQDPHWASLYYRYAVAGTTSYTWAFPNVYNSIALLGFTGVHTMTPIDAVDANVVNDTSVPTAPSITTTRANTMLVVMVTQDLSNMPIDSIANVTQLYSEGGALNVAGGYTPIANAGATGTHTATVPMAGPSISFSIALAPQ